MPQGGGQQPPGGRQLDWRQLVQAVQQSNPNLPPDVLAEAVNQFLPMMNMQSQQEWRMVSLQIREQALQQREQQFMLAEQGRNQRSDTASGDRRAAIDQRSDASADRTDVQRQGIESRERTAGDNRVSRETIAKMTVDERREAHEAGLISKEAMDEANRGSREKIAEGRQETAREAEGGRNRRADQAESGRNERAEMSATVKTAVAKMSTEARREIAAQAEQGKDQRAWQAEGGRAQRAEISAETRKEIARLNANERTAVTEFLEKGRNERSERSEAGREKRFDTTQDLRERQFGDKREVEQQRLTEQGLAREGRERLAEKRMGQQQTQFTEREKRLQEGLDLRSDTTWDRLEQQKQAAMEKAQAAQWKQGAAEVKTLIDEQDKHVRTKIAASNILSASERKKMLEEADKVNSEQLAALRTRAKGGGSAPASPTAPTDQPPVEALKEGQVTTFANGQKWTLKGGKPEQVK